MTNANTVADKSQAVELPFSHSETLSIGVELELQIVSRLDADLTRGATELLAEVAKRKDVLGDFKPEITESMIEVSTGVHRDCSRLAEELQSIRATLIEVADHQNLLITGGGAHPFQHWGEQKIFDKPRFKHLDEMYGYLAKQFTVFGQHIHVGCPNGDEALFLMHGLSRCIPHFIVLSAASPYYQGLDTSYESSRLNAISAFPLSGRAPLVRRWSDFIEYYNSMRSFGVVESMKDFYWDIRPKPEFGTVELRICDTPLTVSHAALLTALAQTLCRYLLVERPFAIDDSLYVVYSHNRFQAARFGYAGNVIDPQTRSPVLLQQDILDTLQRLAPHARELGTEDELARLAGMVQRQENDTRWMREHFLRSASLADLVWQKARRWRLGD